MPMTCLGVWPDQAGEAAVVLLVGRDVLIDLFDEAVLMSDVHQVVQVGYADVVEPVNPAGVVHQVLVVEEAEVGPATIACQEVVGGLKGGVTQLALEYQEV